MADMAGGLGHPQDVPCDRTPGSESKGSLQRPNLACCKMVTPVTNNFANGLFLVFFSRYRTYIGGIWSRKDAIMDNSPSASASARDAAGRFLPGQSGNPAGKRPGTRTRATLSREAFADGEEMVVARAVIDKAKEGDAVSARFLLGLLCPRPRDRAITLDLPDGMSAGDTVAAFNTTLLAMAAGEITPDEALTITRMFDGRLQALRAWELERQMIWVRREHIPGDELFAPPDEEVEEDETRFETTAELL